jgi:hypothetical protein
MLKTEDKFVAFSHVEKQKDDEMKERLHIMSKNKIVTKLLHIGCYLVCKSTIGMWSPNPVKSMCVT